MTTTKRTTTKTAAARKGRKTAKPHTIDGIRYKSGTLVKIHQEMKQAVADGWIKSFTLPQVGDGQKKSKFGAYKAEVDGFIFDSVMEARFYVYLSGLRYRGEIRSFDRQVTYELQPKFRSKVTGKIVLPITYIADFCIIANDGTQTVVDVKGKETDVFLMKKKMMQYRYPELRFLCIQWRASTGTWEDLEDIKAVRRKAKRSKKVG